MKKNKNNKFKTFFIDINKTKLNWSGFLAMCLLFLILDIIAKHLYYHKFNYLLSQNIINFLINTRDLLKNSFVELLLSQISITFLVTSLLSIFGSNEKLIYWENAIEYKLIKPQGQSFKDITAYCLATLPLSVIAIVFKLYLLFIVSFSVNIIGLTVITIKMFTIYFNNEKICTELKNEFYTHMSNGDRIQKICLLEANTYRHIQTGNLSGISQNIMFFTELAAQENYHELIFFPALRIYISLPICTFPDVRANIFIAFFKMLFVINEPNDLRFLFNGSDSEPLIQNKIRNAIIQENTTPIFSFQNYEVLKIAENTIFSKIKSNILDSSIPALYQNDFLFFYEALVIHQPIKKVLRLKYTNRIYEKNDILDFHEYFIKSVSLIKSAHANNCDLAPYIYSLRRIYNYIVHNGLETLEDIGSISVSITPTEDANPISPNQIIDIVNCFSEESALLLFEMLCDEHAINSDRAITLSILNDIYDTTRKINQDTKDKMFYLLKNSTIEFKEYLLANINPNYTP